MTQINAYQWWNSLVDYNGDKSDVPLLPTPKQMVSVCQEISPILYVYLHDQIDKNDFWMTVMSVLKRVTKIDPFPDPRYNFKLFLLYFYTFREFLKPKNVDTCILYALTFCPSPPKNFFIDIFIYAISDPILVIQAFHKLNETKNPQWLAFISQPGNAERFFDLFLPSLSPQTEPDNSKLTAKIYLSNLLTDLFLNHLDMALFKQVALSLYKTLTELIRSLLDYDAVPFLRDVFALEDALSAKSLSSSKFFFDKYYRWISNSSLLRSMFYNWCFSHFNNMKPSIFINSVVRLKMIDLSTFEILERTALAYPKETSMTVVQFLSSMLFKKKQWMMASAHILHNILSSPNLPEYTKKWFEVFLHYSFIAATTTYEIKKYTNRTTMFLSCLSSSYFMSIEWTKDTILKNASIALYLRFHLISHFFKVKSTRNNKWEVSYKKYRKLRNIKDLPFKKNKDTLIMFHDDMFIKYESNDCDPNIAQLGASPTASKFLIFDPELQLNDQRQVLFDLEDFIDSEKARIKECEKLKISSSFEMPLFISNEDRYTINKAIAASITVNNKIFKYQKSQIYTTIEVVNELSDLIHKHKELSTNIKSLAVYYDKIRLSDSVYTNLKKHRAIMKSHIVRNLAQAISNMQSENSLNDHIAVALYQYNSDALYSPYNEFDKFLSDKIRKYADVETINKIIDSIKTNKSKSIIRPKIKTPAKKQSPTKTRTNIYGKVEKNEKFEFVNNTIDLLVQRILNEVGVFTVQTNSIVTITLIRYFFSVAFSEDSILNSYQKENLLIIKKASILSNQQIEVLDFESGIIPASMNKCQIKAYFKGKKMPNIRCIEFESNHVDILFIIFSAMKHFYDSNPNISGKDMQKIIYALIITQPPSNSFSIMIFLQKWYDLYITNDLKTAAKYYIQSVKNIINYKAPDNTPDDKQT
ncbi:hypothetical protein TRFO_03325 [Tritrichomonas foetus]|uniref:Uncharacterized protein n=1 Tax=Tritrichomonas foetus TaxID=1144522 RepID=A0A1J4KQI7_9EUKA|nr:hypothetical protein TRFO_03325 [Tritrichomonas foetus]|eukprot:OHT13569.1 hypothetical protein TRFO_03325 [Tritrichomonas foetus]